MVKKLIEGNHWDYCCDQDLITSISYCVSKLTFARVLLWVRLINYLFKSMLLWALKQDWKITHHKKNLNKLSPSNLHFECDYFSKDLKVRKILMSVNLCLDSTVCIYAHTYIIS